MRYALPKWILPLLAIGIALLAWAGLATATVVDLEDLGVSAPDQYENGAGMTGGGFTSGGLRFNNDYTVDPQYGPAWLGWAYSSMTDTATPGYGNQYSAFPGSGADGSLTYGVGFPGYKDWINQVLYYPEIEIPAGQEIQSAMVTNTTYAALAIRDGNDGPGAGFVKKFGGPSGDEQDWFLLTITGLNETDQPIAASPVEFYLADYRSDDNLLDYVVDDWRPVNLSSLAAARKLRFSLSSTDNDLTYDMMMTPAYFAIDNLVWVPAGGDAAVPEPSTFVLALVAALFFICRSRLCRGR